jgi:hypothetical protein
MAATRLFPQIVALLAILILAVAVLVLMVRPTWTVDRVRDVVVTTLQQETPASELVTGRVGVTASREIQDRGRFSWIPEWIGVPGVNFVGAGVRVEVVGEALYGFDVRQLTAEMIHMTDDGAIEVEIPTIYVVAVEPDLARLQLRSREGLLRRGAGRPLEEEALGDVQHALREQGELHLQQSAQPSINTGQALASMLRPAFRSAGMANPRFRFLIGGDLVLEPREQSSGVSDRAGPREL